MAYLPEKAKWVDKIYEIQVTDKVKGGPGGTANIQAEELAWRTLYLKERLDNIVCSGSGGSGLFGFDIVDGHLILHYRGDNPPRFWIDEHGHLKAEILPGNNTSVISNLGRVLPAFEVLEDTPDSYVWKFTNRDCETVSPNMRASKKEN